MAPRPRSAGRPLIAAVLALALLPAAAPPGQDAPRPPPRPSFAEERGPLDSDVFLPEAAEAVREALAAGDAAARALEGGGQPQAWIGVFEAWRSALSGSAPGESVSAPSGAEAAADGSSARRTEDVAYAVERRLLALDPERRAAWRRHFASLSELELEAAGRDPARLSEVARRNPGTAAAARATLRLGDLAFEEGRPAAALAWIERAERHLGPGVLGPEDPDAALLAALGARRDAARELLDLAAASASATPRDPDEPEPPGWAGAERVRQLVVLPLADAATPGRQGRGPGQGAQPGLVELADGRVAVQTPEVVHLIDPREARLEGGFQPHLLLEPLGAGRFAGEVPGGAPGWPLLPATDGRSLLLVAGSSGPASPNALAWVLPPPRRDPGQVATPLPELRWAVAGSRRLGPDGAVEDVPELAALGELEIQPGPCLVGGLAVAQVWQRSRTSEDGFGDRRFQGAGEVSAWLAAFELASGRLAWLRFLAKGSERTGGVPAAGSPWRVSAGQPLAAAGLRVLAGTHLGATALVDAVDGRVAWTVETRRAPDGEGWRGRRPIVLGGELPAFVLAPADGDHVYWLRTTPDLDGRGLLLRPPQPRGRAVALVGADAERAFVAGRFGARPALSVLEAATGERRDAIHLGLEERFTGRGTLFAGRAAIATDRALYLFETGRDLYLLDATGAEARLRDAAPARDAEGFFVGGEVFATATHLFLVGFDHLRLYEPD